MAYRSAQHEATIHTPAKLMFGKELRLPVDLATRRPSQEVTDPISNYAQMLEVKYNVGDHVWLHNPLRKRGLSPKLQSPWEGPYEILQVMSDVTYKIRRGPQKRSRVVHADRLWRYYGPGLFSWGGRESKDREVEVNEEE
ncbi:uncharacterized protein [Penaeus vannamei]|uniref:uncharacterized protein n=1 Tax=Penaeus vannamei TaxID=6689 RepID=UPI00387FA9E3